MGEYMGIQSANRREIPKTTTNHLYHNQDVLKLDLPDLLPPDGDRSPRRPLKICSPSSYQDDSRASHRHPRPIHPASSCQGSRTGGTLSGVGPFTVFAPTNDAFAKIPADALTGLLADKDALTAVLLRHVVPGAALKAKDVPHGT